MLSYQHIYHAGNLADVHKHSILVQLLYNLIQKDRPLSYLETHAGRGIYDLSSFEAKKTGEAVNGIEKILNNAKSTKDPYLQLIIKIKDEFGASCYPGSPLIAQQILRQNDQIFLMELHPQEIKYLYKLKNLNGAKINIHHRDGYEGILAISPPQHKRGLVLIDPSYENKNEYSKVIDFIQTLYKKWPQAVIMLWYPILPENYHLPMIKKLKELNLKDLVVNENIFKPKPIKGMQGSGIVVINTPWNINIPSSEVLLNDPN